MSITDTSKTKSDSDNEGFRLRGREMTRIEVFVDAGFAFAVTMLVISFDQIPRSYDEMVIAIKGVPAFFVAAAQMIWIWHVHSVWSRRYGLEDAKTVFLSAALLTVVLVYIYPLRIMASGMMNFFTNGFLPTEFFIEGAEQLRFMFVFLGAGFISICLIFSALYAHANSKAQLLELTDSEQSSTRTIQWVWLGCGSIGVLAIILAFAFPDPLVPFSGFAYSLLGVWIPFFMRFRYRRQSTQAREH